MPGTTSRQLPLAATGASHRLHDGTRAQIELWGDQVDVALYDRWPKPAVR